MIKTDNRYIGAGQAAVIMAAAGILGLTVTDFTAPGTMLSNAVSAIVLTAVLLIPLAILIKDGSGSVPQLAVMRTGLIGRVISVLYSIFFISAASDIIARYSVFVSERYYEASAAVCAVLLGVICVYISHTGAETVCRMSTVLIFMLAVTGAAYAINGFGDILSYDYTKIVPEEISPAGSISGIFPFAAAGAAAICVLCGGLGSRTRAAAFGGAAAMLAAVSLVIVGVWAVLDDFTTVSDYPMADAVIYSFREMSFRTDGVFFMLWTVIAAAVSSLMCACAGHSLKAAVPKFRWWGVLTAAAALIGAQAELWGINVGSIYRSPICAVILVGIIPLVLLLLPQVKERK